MKNARNKNIFLIGPLGAGKSTIGRALARILKKKFYDTDRMIEEYSGVSISWIMDIEGEDNFHEREFKALEELDSLTNIVVATGGGIVLLEKCRKFMKEHGLVVHLNVDLKEQFKRTQRNRYNRPLLRVNNIEEKLMILNREREHLFQEISDVSFTTQGKTIMQIAREIAKWAVDFLPNLKEYDKIK